MANTIKIGNISISSFKVGQNDCSIYLGATLLYSGGTTPPTPPTPTGCYEVIPDPITAYTATTYDSVYSWSVEKWYMKNNLDEYEEYGVYDIVEDISSATTYEGKLAVVGTTEYEYSGGSWTVVGTYVNNQTTLTITEEDQHAYSGQTLPTTFKIPKEEMDNVGSFGIRDTNDGNLNIDREYYEYYGDDIYEGTVTSDSVYYYYYSMETLQSIVIDRIRYYNEDPLHLTYGTIEATVEYAPKAAPSSATTYSTVADMEAVTCPNVGVGEYCYVTANGNVYEYTSNEEWVIPQASSIYVKAFNGDGSVAVGGYNQYGSLNTLSKGMVSNSAVSVTIGDSITSLGENVFSGNTSLSSITLTENITTIGNAAFKQCTSLTSITLPSGLTSIGEEAFYLCTSLASVNIPSGLTNMGSRAFVSCSSLPVENNVRYADTYAVEAIDRTVTSYQIKQGTRFIGDFCFRNSSAVTSVEIPDSVEDINNYAFENCKAVTNITIGSGVTKIRDYSFARCVRLGGVILPESLTSLGNAVFSGCTNILGGVAIPSGITSIGYGTFEDCRYLGYVEIPDTVISIGNNAFRRCSGMTSVHIGSGITSLGNQAFNNCKKLSAMTIDAATPPVLENYALSATNDCPIYVPSGQVVTYKTTSGYDSSRIFPSTYDYLNEPLTLICKDANVNTTFTFHPNEDYVGKVWVQNTYSSSWYAWDVSGGTTVSFTTKNRSVRWKADIDIGKVGSFTANAHFDVAGNPMSMIWEYGFENKRSLSGIEGAFSGMFNYQSNLENAENLKLPATTLSPNCYNRMFEYCTNLMNAPELPATTLDSSCYEAMFQSCTNLYYAPELPATTLAFGCYNDMFSECSNLTYIKAMFLTEPDWQYTSQWVNNVNPIGTFIKNSAATWSVSCGANTYPCGWDVLTDNS